MLFRISLQHALLVLTALIFVQLTLAIPILYKADGELTPREELSLKGVDDLSLLLRELVSIIHVESHFLSTDILLSKEDEIAARSLLNRPVTIAKKAVSQIKEMVKKTPGAKVGKIVKWHKDQVRKHMKKDPNLKGTSATVQHAAHSGGSNPKEKIHITAMFKKGKEVKGTVNPWTKAMTKLHHVYTNNRHPPGAQAPHVGPKSGKKSSGNNGGGKKR
ncbi:hypothetical protein NMY22_g7628 [Coprinellus aureogranulatus]|nr:hypothetical protein NMY22_g7628 [Coprinellus aureogranulatus]